MKKVSATYKMRMSKEDVTEALKLYIELQGGDLDGEVKIDPEFAREYYQVGMFDEDYQEFFDGLTITVTEFQNV